MIFAGAGDKGEQQPVRPETENVAARQAEQVYTGAEDQRVGCSQEEHDLFRSRRQRRATARSARRQEVNLARAKGQGSTQL